jgi:hypothetical protein
VSEAAIMLLVNDAYRLKLYGPMAVCTSHRRRESGSGNGPGGLLTTSPFHTPACPLRWRSGASLANGRGFLKLSRDRPECHRLLPSERPACCCSGRGRMGRVSSARPARTRANVVISQRKEETR